MLSNQHLLDATGELSEAPVDFCQELPDGDYVERIAREPFFEEKAASEE